MYCTSKRRPRSAQASLMLCRSSACTTSAHVARSWLTSSLTEYTEIVGPADTSQLLWPDVSFDYALGWDLVTHRPANFHWKETCAEQIPPAPLPILEVLHLLSLTHGLDHHLRKGFSSTSRTCTHSYSTLLSYIAFYLPVSIINLSKKHQKNTVCHFSKKVKGTL